MKKTVILGLLIVNGVLATFLAMKFLPDKQAVAQVRRPGDYIIIPAEVQGGNSGVVFIVDTTNGEMSAIALDENAANKKLAAMPRMNLTDLLNNAAAGGRTGNK
jgi:hypothetical protein